MSRVAEGLCYSFILTLSCLDLCVVLQFQEYFEAAENMMGSPLFAKGEGFNEDIGCGVTNGEKRVQN